MRALVTISYTLQLEDEEELFGFAKSIEEGMTDGMRKGLLSVLDGRELDPAVRARIDEILGYYGATITLERPILEGIE